jgi:hypothetical protein
MQDLDEVQLKNIVEIGGANTRINDKKKKPSFNGRA